MSNICCLCPHVKWAISENSSYVCSKTKEVIKLDIPKDCCDRWTPIWPIPGWEYPDESSRTNSFS